MNRISKIHLAVLTLALLALGSCKGGGGPTSPTPEPLDINQLDTYGFTTNGQVVRFTVGANVNFYIASGEGVSGWSPGLESAAARQMTAWNDVGDKWGIYHVSQTEKSSNGDVRVVWVDSLGGNAAGRTSFQAQGGRLILPILIELPTHVNGRTVSQSEVALAAVHEMGHALGLWQHSPYSGDVMYPIAMNGVPSKRDRNTIYKLYNTAAHITNAVREPSAASGEPIVTYSIECGADCIGR
ncbi:MAG: matrixin family metalloprotease [bacterium]